MRLDGGLWCDANGTVWFDGQPFILDRREGRVVDGGSMVALTAPVPRERVRREHCHNMGATISTRDGER